MLDMPERQQRCLASPMLEVASNYFKTDDNLPIEYKIPLSNEDVREDID